MSSTNDEFDDTGRFVCRECVDTPNAGTPPPKDLVGCVVKIGFPANHPQVHSEWMWIGDCVSAVDNCGDEMIIGSLGNVPQFATYLHHGDTVCFRRSDIAAWQKESECE